MKEFNCTIKFVSICCFIILAFFSIMCFVGNGNKLPDGIARFIFVVLSYYAITFLLMGIILSVNNINLVKGIIFTIINIIPVIYIFVICALDNDGIMFAFMMSAFPILFSIVPITVTARSIVEKQNLAKAENE